ncbi:hypothetical protein PYCCODRAFT_753167 [Trametes coccinea BRFM310]|uniref:Uncharacterized protein n=1 Tax=Trametes coccinea (strain BRFM310) TaxID=1353009 RepID=A0A1Y2IFG3_TRAC3|nr:hypothetical protein PYCCODRAFT_753167 [Trametes coccinea BRFM310]
MYILRGVSERWLMVMVVGGDEGGGEGRDARLKCGVAKIDAQRYAGLDSLVTRLSRDRALQGLLLCVRGPVATVCAVGGAGQGRSVLCAALRASWDGDSPPSLQKAPVKCKALPLPHVVGGPIMD